MGLHDYQLLYSSGRTPHWRFSRPGIESYMKLFISFPFTKLTCISIGLIWHTKYCLILKMREAMFHEHFLDQFKMDF